jgi:TP901 family phage tail tape measure protein
LTDEINRLSTDLGVYSGTLAKVSVMLSQAGFTARDTKVALDTLAKTELSPTFDNIIDTTEGAIAIFNQFGKGADALRSQLGSLNKVAGAFAVESGDLVQAVRRVGGVFKSSGGDLNELMALFTSVRQTTRENAESIATALKTIFVRIQRPKTIEYLRQFGVELTDAAGRFIGPLKAIEKIYEVFGNLPQGDLRLIEAGEVLAGFRQIGKFIPLIQQYRITQEALNVAKAGENSLDEDAAKAKEGLANRLSRLNEEFLLLIRNIYKMCCNQC